MEKAKDDYGNKVIQIVSVCTPTFLLPGCGMQRVYKSHCATYKERAPIADPERPQVLFAQTTHNSARQMTECGIRRVGTNSG
jgi:hypothetical protein